MPNNEFDNWSITKLEIEYHQTTIPERKSAILDALEKQKNKKDIHDQLRLSKTIFWSKIAGIAAILGVVLMIVQILISVHQESTLKRYDGQITQSQGKNSQRPTRNQVNQTSSSNISSSTTPSKKSK